MTLPCVDGARSAPRPPPLLRTPPAIAALRPLDGLRLSLLAEARASGASGVRARCGCAGDAAVVCSGVDGSRRGAVATGARAADRAGGQSGAASAADAELVLLDDLRENAPRSLDFMLPLDLQLSLPMAALPLSRGVVTGVTAALSAALSWPPVLPLREKRRRGVSRPPRGVARGVAGGVATGAVAKSAVTAGVVAAPRALPFAFALAARLGFQPLFAGGTSAPGSSRRAAEAAMVAARAAAACALRRSASDIACAWSAAAAPLTAAPPACSLRAPCCGA
jgi:hypothetical protein